MVRQLFGTDGVRGVAGEFLTAELALSLARAAVRLSPEPRPRVLIVRDTRESGEMLEAALAAGVTAAGGDAYLAGVLPTPAAPLLLRRHDFHLAAVISASHNPYEDNGIKLFGPDGFKLDDDTEVAIEAVMMAPHPDGGRRPARIGRVRTFHGALEDYLRELHTRFGALDLGGQRILLDCAHGATYRAAPEIFRRLGAEVTVLCDRPDGQNINAGCGSTHLGRLTEALGTGDSTLGFAFDGDGDRVLAVDGAGITVDGDELIALAARHLKAAGALWGDGVAVTVMTNYGFQAAMADAGIEVAQTAVGDRYVLDELRRRGWRLGGEQSGHIIDLAFAPGGDGIASALLILEALGGADLRDRDAMEKLPQRLVNLRAGDRSALTAALGAPAVIAAIAAADSELAGRGRVLVRASGTEPLVRVMVEAPTVSETDAHCAEIAAAVEAALTGPPG
ncbi:phosphoglucosamine mutase [Conexibacter sp. DBS9H8]|uniref:phosphoglucosamine mutase n=1 Tax=Conexibacter sp. DBS9H8 TaxID=2937801 RepID=UPI00200DA3CC|nr:phosphoglucosamine mutase [Conexibacter sp. DBS9H8]